MIILDFSQVIFAQISVEFERNKNNTVSEDILRHMILNQLRSLHVKFRDQYGQMIIAMDGKNYWRKDIFPHYKGNRKIEKDKSLIDWKAVFEITNKIRDEIIEHIPIPSIRLEGVEADDIISVACQGIGNHQPVLIVSSDKDFKQLQVFKKVKQWSPIHDKFIKEDKPLVYLKTHIVEGDKGDGIPDLVKPLDYFVNKPPKLTMLTQDRREKLESYFSINQHSPYNIEFSLDCPSDVKERIELNNKLVNLVDSTINPKKDEIINEIIKALAKAKMPAKSPLFYFNQKGLKMLSSRITDFIPKRETA